MNAMLAVLRGPLDAGVLYPQIYLAAALLVLKLFDWWSTHYIVVRKGGKETMSLALWLMSKLGERNGIMADFALVAICGWILYPLYWQWLAGVVAWYAYWMALQAKEVRKIQLNITG